MATPDVVMRIVEAVEKSAVPLTAIMSVPSVPRIIVAPSKFADAAFSVPVGVTLPEKFASFNVAPSAEVNLVPAFCVKVPPRIAVSAK